MSKQIQTGDLRAPAGLLDKGYRIYIPRLFENGDYKLPTRSSSILKGLLKYRSKTFKEGGRLKLQKRFSTDFGFGTKLSEVISSRSIYQIKRMEQLIAGILDSLLLFDSNLFVTEKNYNLLKHLVRKIITVSTFNIGTVVKYWKSYGNHVFVQSSDSETLEKPKKEVENFFFCLDSLEKIQRIRQGNLTKKDLTDLSQLISSRQLPAGDKKTEEDSLREFFDITTRIYNPDSSILEDLYKASRIIGRKCRKAGPGPIGNAHISLATAGSFQRSVIEGGRAREIKDSITPYLTYIPKEDGQTILPFTTLREEKGVPRWRTWCRNETYLGYPETEFGERTKETIAGFEVFYQGFDEAIGEQILCCAYLAKQNEMQKEGIPLRVLTITEPGCKARIVTTGPWWLYVLQQSMAHVTRGFLSSHPSAEAGMARTDQAWQYLYLICKARPSFKEDFACLSSDLKSATDTIPPKVATQLLKGFLHGLGYLTPLEETIFDLLETPRICFAEKIGKTFFTTTGVFMGEPLAKTILTLENLAVEELAIRQYLKVNFNVPVQVPWRCYAVAGDDHIAIGPREYLRRITANHLRCNTIISKAKHGISAKHVLFCEKILDIKNIWNLSWTPKTINDSYEVYESSPHIDSIKVRLLSPCSKNNESFNDRNTAVGKASSLGNTLRWISPVIYNHKFKSLIRDRFFQRMGSLLPDRSSGVYWHLLLPKKLGGLGLWLETDYLDLAKNLPDPTKSDLLDYLNGSLSRERLNLLRGFTSNVSYRGFNLEESEVSLVKEFIIPDLQEIYSGMSIGQTWEDWVIEKNISSELSAKQQQNRLRGLKLYTVEEIEDQVLRPFLFKQILSGQAKSSAFNTESFKRRYSKYWDMTFSGHVTLTEKDISAIIEKPLEKEVLYDCSMKFPTVIHGIETECTFLEEMTIGLPNLKIKNLNIGTLTGTVNETDFSLGEYV